ncbi:MAG: O-antigen ligase family protein [Candidatus Levybacteria bacterium]|nr:O-antigen ligase family protein [Candidatus Levybacteria bacterium]
MKILKWIWGNFLFIFTIFLLAFIPLYPKIPLLDVEHTWVYVRVEDFAVTFIVLVWIILLLLKKVSLKTPLTIPIMIFWVIGGLTTLHGVLILFPTLANVFSNVAFLSYLRRIEYMSLFFIAYASIKDKKFIAYVAVSLAIILLLVVGYGFGQKFLGFPAFLTMNEEFAKGVPIQLSDLSRVPSTFAGQYDLAAYLVLIVPLLVSLVFGFKKLIIKIFLLITSTLGFALLFMTVSRVSFFALLLSLLILLILQKKKMIILSLLVLTFALLIFSPSLLQRFKSTVSEINVLVDAKTGGAIGQVKEVPAAYFKDKIIRRIANTDTNALSATVSAIVPFQLIPPIAPVVIEANSSTGENLPQGTSYINLPLSPVIKKVDAYFFQKLTNKGGVESDEISAFYGDFLIKTVKAYDLSFTTRFQGEWPKTFDAFKRNIFLGSGFGSVSLAVDNNYLRILGESGLFGLIAFLSIFIIALIYARKLLPKVDSPIIRSFVIGFLAGSFGLALNAFLIDVFEASKIAFTYWLLMGVVIGALHLYKKEEIDLFGKFKKVIISPYAIVVYIFVSVAAFFSPILSNYFVGDDFTWFGWTQNCCSNVANYFTQANGFFYRPGTKLYFSLMYSAFWLNQAMYHLVSILLHFAVSVLAFLVLRKILKNYFLAIICVFLFVILSSHHEDIFWISSTGFLFNAFFALTGLLSFIFYKEKKKIAYLIISLASIIFSLFFHELGVVVPLLIIVYDFIFGEKLILNKLSRKATYLILLSPILPYLLLRFIAQSHWFSGDYSYNIFKLPYNILGNIIGYLLLNLLGPQSLTFYEASRNFLKVHLLIAVPLSLAVFFGFIIIYKIIMKKLEERDRKIIVFGLLFFLIALLPFLGLGNITSRYSYLSSVGFVILLGVLLKKTYIYLIGISNKYIGTASIIIIAITFLMVQLFALQKIGVDWKSAGEETQGFLISVEQYSKDSWIREKMQFYFVGMPIRNGEAWVWPVGLQDALWLTFKNPNLAVYTVLDINSAFDQAKTKANSHVFRFASDGSVDEVVRAKNGEINLLNPPR